MRPTWSGAIGFGLVSIPINVYSATQESTLDLDLLHEKDMGRVGYQKICKAEDKPVSNDEIVRGYEVSKDEYVILTDEELESAGHEKSKTINILHFVDVSDVDSIYFEKPYYLEPEEGGEKSYTLLREVLKKSKRAAIAQFVMKNKEHLALVKPMDNALVLNIMRFPEEVRDMSELKIPSTSKVNPKEFQLAMSLVDQLADKFNPYEFKDTYRENLMQLIEDKAAGRKRVAEPEEETVPSNVRDIMGLLKASLEKSEGGKTKTTTRRKRTTKKAKTTSRRKKSA